MSCYHLPILDASELEKSGACKIGFGGAADRSWGLLDQLIVTR
jgi:hypothetical protein